MSFGASCIHGFVVAEQDLTDFDVFCSHQSCRYFRPASTKDHSTLSDTAVAERMAHGDIVQP